jgi:hypothetical protein
VLLPVFAARMVCMKCGFARCTTPKDDHVLAECSTGTRRTRDTLAGYEHLGMGASMTTFQILVLGMMAAWTPSLIVIAYFLWRETM